jgi:hypothetical protein
VGVAVLFARSNSVYKSIPGCDVWDAERDARNWQGGMPVVAHPPCRAWGRFSWAAKPRPDERALAPWAIDQVRAHGGVVEHPIGSALWDAVGCLGYGMRDRFGGVLVPVLQSWWGHRAPKETGLYIVGPVPEFPYDDTPATGRIENMGQAERERTPEPFARFLVYLAESCQ